jgi:hypothetical protein
MFASLAIAAVLAAPVDGPAVDADSFVRIIKERTAPLKSLAFVYEGEMRWTGPRELIKDPDGFGEQFGGAYLYRADGAAFYDVYSSRLLADSWVQRHRISALDGRQASLNEDFEPQPGGPRNPFFEGRGTIENFDNMDSPHALFMSWYWPYAGKNLARHYRFEGWEDVGGRNCLRFAIVRYLADPKDDKNFRRYWVDLERNAQVLKMEYVGNGRVGQRIEGIVLVPFPLPDGTKYWMPTRCRVMNYTFDDRLLDEPVFERTYTVVARSVRLNADLPDALFSLKRDEELPGELEKLRHVPATSALRRRYEAQTEPIR